MKNGFVTSVVSQVQRLPTADGERSVTVFEHGTLRMKFYAPRGEDLQTPHSQDEGYVVYTGSGEFVCEDERE